MRDFDYAKLAGKPADPVPCIQAMAALAWRARGFMFALMGEACRAFEQVRAAGKPLVVEDSTATDRFEMRANGRIVRFERLGLGVVVIERANFSRRDVPAELERETLALPDTADDAHRLAHAQIAAAVELLFRPS